MGKICEACKSVWCQYWVKCQRCGGGRSVKMESPKPKREPEARRD